MGDTVSPRSAATGEADNAGFAPPPPSLPPGFVRAQPLAPRLLPERADADAEGAVLVVAGPGNSGCDAAAAAAAAPAAAQFGGVRRFCGTSLDNSGQWRAEVFEGGVKHLLGPFPSEDEAARAWDAVRPKGGKVGGEARAVPGGGHINSERPGNPAAPQPAVAASFAGPNPALRDAAVTELEAHEALVAAFLGRPTRTVGRALGAADGGGDGGWAGADAGEGVDEEKRRRRRKTAAQAAAAAADQAPPPPPPLNPLCLAVAALFAGLVPEVSCDAKQPARIVAKLASSGVSVPGGSAAEREVAVAVAMLRIKQDAGARRAI